MEQEFYDKMIGFYVTPEMNKQFSELCKQLSINKSELLRTYVQSFIDSHTE